MVAVFLVLLSFDLAVDFVPVRAVYRVSANLRSRLKPALFSEWDVSEINDLCF